jgi:hypothetical protein
MDLVQLTPWYKDPVAWSVIATAVATIVYAIISSGLWKATKRTAEIAERTADITQRIFEAANRPYIGIDRVNAIDEELKKGVDIVVKNFGTIPARELCGQTTMKTDKQVVFTNEAGPTILCQGGEFVIGIMLSTELYSDAIVSNKVPLFIKTELWYKGLGDVEYHVCYNYEYAPERGGFRLKGATESSTKEAERNAERIRVTQSNKINQKRN